MHLKFAEALNQILIKMKIIVETFRNPGEPSSSKVRVRPMAGQFKETYRVWCSQIMRRSQPVGALFRVCVTRVDQPDGESYLRIGLHDWWEPVSRDEVETFIREQYRIIMGSSVVGISE